MHRILEHARSRAGLFAVLATIVVAVATVPLFGSTAYAAGVNLQNTVSKSEFVIPGAPVTKIATPIGAGTAAPFAVNTADVVTAGLFPLSGEILVSKTEVMVYNNTDLTGAGPCGAQDSSTFCVTARAKVGAQGAHALPTAPFDQAGRIRLATQSTAVLPAGTQTTLSSSMTAAAVPPFAITLASGAGFPAAGQISITHQDADAGGQATEYFTYNSSCGNGPGGAPPQLCVTARARNANNVPSAHSASGYDQPCNDNNAVTCPQPGVTKVTLHQDLTVKSTTGFFPASVMLIFTLSGGGVASAQELVGTVKGDAAAKLTSPPPASGTVFRIVSRAGATAGQDKTPNVSHPSGSVVTGPYAYTMCRARNESPAAFSGAPATSVGLFSVCQTRTEPGDQPKDSTTGKLDIPMSGSTLVILNGLAQPFLSTGGFTHLLYGPVPVVDTDGTTGDANDCDGDGNTTEFLLCLISPCIVNFTPGTNLLVDVKADTDKSYTTPDTGSIKVVLDTVTGPGGGTDGNPATHDDCDDPAGIGDIALDTYFTPCTGPGTPPSHPNCTAADPPGDNDTDGDTCEDNKELDNSLSSGGQRDPWNEWDFYDPNGNGSVELGEIFAVAGKFGAVAPGPPYTAAEDRGPTFGPFAHNTSQPDGAIALADIFAIAGQFGHAC